MRGINSPKLQLIMIKQSEFTKIELNKMKSKNRLTLWVRTSFLSNFLCHQIKLGKSIKN